MVKWVYWALFLVAMSSFDALRDVGRGQFGYWTWHICKWLSFYPPLLYIWWRKVFSYRPKLGIVVIVLCWIAWTFWATVFRPEHWGEGGLLQSQWLRWLF